MKKRGLNRNKCFWYMHGKCSRDPENTIAIIPCTKKCKFFVLYVNVINDMKEERLCG
jgi:hypothetical protein